MRPTNGCRGLERLPVTSQTMFGGAAASQYPAGCRPGPVDLNTASAERLESLPGMGPVRAGHIVADRELSGPFLTIVQIMRMQRIEATTYTDIRELVTVGESP